MKTHSFFFRERALNRSLALLLALFPVISGFPDVASERAAAVLGDRAKMATDTRWIYNDWKRGFETAKETGKPLLIVMRCVPCKACLGIDAGVLTDPELSPLLDKFVKVRVVNANAIDLRQFQFDYDLSFSTLFFNGDGTVYGRFGSWTHQKNSQDKDTAGFRHALENALAIHQGYPGNKEALKSKQGTATPVSDPLQLPELAGHYKRELDWEGKVAQSCVHCHQVGEGMRAYYREQGKTIPRELIYPMPTPETVGLALAPDQVARAQSVAKNSAAEAAGLKAGDDIVSVNGTPLVAVADFSWALHHTGEAGMLALKIKRGGETVEAPLQLAKDWRLHSDISGRVGTWSMRAMALGGMLLEELAPEERAERGIANGTMALRVKHAGEYGKHAAAKNAGFRKDDVLIEVDGIAGEISESELIGRLIEKHQPGDKAEVVALRGKEKIQLTLPIQ